LAADAAAPAETCETGVPSVTIEDRIAALGLYLPAPAKTPPSVVIDFAWARAFGDRVFISGHGPQAADGSFVGPFGRVGAEVTPEQAAESAKLAALSAIASLKRAVGSLDRVVAVLRVDGFVLAAPGFDRTTNVINGASRLIVDIFGEEIGRHARTAMGVAATPLSCPVVIAAEVAIRL
jgi:enamine deaminase RidA (YjgF/YER057c/UK114 family)